MRVKRTLAPLLLLTAACAAAPARAGDWLSGARRAAAEAAVPGEAAPEPPKTDWVPFEPESQLFAADVPPEGWTPFEEEDAQGPVTRLLGPDEPEGRFRATLSVRYVDRDAPDYRPPKDAVEAMRGAVPLLKREATPVRDLRTAAGLARVFELVETRRLPEDEGPSVPTELHAYVAVIPRGDAYYLVRLWTTRAAYLDQREFFLRFLRSFRAVGAR